MKKAHFIGICGTGMSATASLLKQQGWLVSGSDENAYPPVNTMLNDAGIVFNTHYNAANIPKDADVIVIGKHARLTKEENVEVKAAFDSGITIQSFPDVLDSLTKQTHNLVIVGSYGKTTSTALAAYLLTSSGKDVSFFVGGQATNLNSNAHLGTDKEFIIEGDEYPSAAWDNTPKFLHFNPSSIMITAAEHDHFNVFSTLRSYLKPFKDLVGQIPPSGKIIACLDGPNVTEVTKHAGVPVITYSFRDTNADWYASNCVVSDYVEFDLIHHKTKIAHLKTVLIGDHSVQNIVGTLALLLEHNLIAPEQIQIALPQFVGVKRRLERKTAVDKMPVYEDFGSSYEKALAGITTIRKQYPDKHLRILFEPHTFSFRNSSALPWYDTLFAGADSVIILQPPQHGAVTHNQLGHQQIIDRVSATGIQTVGVSSATELLSTLKNHIDPKKDVVLIETSGDLDGAIPAIVEWANSL